MKKRACCVLLLTLGILGWFGIGKSGASMPDVMCVSVTGNYVNIHSTPSLKGKILTKIGDIMMDGCDLLVDPVPILDRNDHSEWYEILFVCGYFFNPFVKPNDLHRHSWFISATDKYKIFNYTHPYISAKCVEKKENQNPACWEPYYAYPENGVEWYAQGRPPRVKIGDRVKELGKYTKSKGPYRKTSIKKQLTLFKEPNRKAEKFSLPAGSRVVDPDPEWIGGTDAPHVPLGYHKDMDDKAWLALVDANTLEVIGWTEYSPYIWPEFESSPEYGIEIKFDGKGGQKNNVILGGELLVYLDD
jgi:hypothetical protein